MNNTQRAENVKAQSSDEIGKQKETHLIEPIDDVVEINIAALLVVEQSAAVAYDCAAPKM